MARKQNVVMPDTSPEKADGMVMVCLNRPTGIKFNLKGGRTVAISGNAVDLKGKDMGVLPVGAYGMTMVKQSDWEEIKTTYGKSMPIFDQGLIFARGDAASAIDEAKDKAELRGGLEPIEPNRAHTKGVQASEVI